ncbi:PAS domain-containing protein [Nocardioides anomalus]|uniref:histidine kinase n=1 Tax=Nocardioides anomalus TaxID=2712223 RepID=A0A6G6W9D4_9ACTN|nr:PAS domain-containing protein [Nocardioides anomalus]QIG41961.1 PAS domain-containing protein [Nocardioides anomalus]
MADEQQDRLDQALRDKTVAEEALRDLQARVDNAQRLANIGDYDWEIATDTNRWSDQLYRIFGHEPQSFDGTYERFLSMVHPDDRETVQATHQRAYATGEPYEMVERIVRPDGEVRYLSTNGQVLTDDSGTPLRFRGTCVDITDRIRAEQARERHAADAHEAETRRQAALEINDSVVQGLTAALYALELEDDAAVRDYVRRTLDSARAIITDLIAPADGRVAPGDLVRTTPSALPS